MSRLFEITKTRAINGLARYAESFFLWLFRVIRYNVYVVVSLSVSSCFSVRLAKSRHVRQVSDVRFPPCASGQNIALGNKSPRT